MCIDCEKDLLREWVVASEEMQLKGAGSKHAFHTMWHAKRNYVLRRKKMPKCAFDVAIFRKAGSNFYNNKTL
jgi:hypothetical protein